ncbi:MAG: hypothetical protein KDK34_20535, partial [Leptospiraceae bacterium]|nr:hypothetical protein [Leptospiraceae bacterium]
LRNDTTGFTAVGASIDRTLARARFGIASLSIETVGSVVNEGAYYRVNGLRDVSEAVTASVYVRGEGKVRLRLIDNPNGKQWVSDEIFLNDIAWKRVEVSGFTTGSNDVRLYIETSDTQTITFYADGFQLERKPYATTYCDGEQPGCYWNGTYNSSYSTRYADTREGGRWVSPMDDKDVYITTVGGLGVAPIRNNIQPYADAPGSYYQNNKIQNRVWTVLFHVKHPQLVRMSNKNSLEKLHGLRQTLFNIFQPDKTAGGQEILVEYQDGPKPLYFRARYDSGFEGEWDIRNGFIQSFPVRFLIVSPLFFNDSYEVASLSIRNREMVNYVLQRYAGEWRSMNGGMDGNILNFAIGRNGEIYAVGEFIHANNSASATDPQIFANFIAYWDGDQWQQVGSGANGFIYDIAVGANGYVYVVGDFTSIGGVAANRIAYWNGSSWNAMSTGFNDIAYGIAVDANGNVFAG